MAEAYYFSQLNKAQQKAYYAVKAGLESLAPSFSVPRLSSEEMAEVFSFVRLDNPQIFYAPSFNYSYARDADSVEFEPEYLFKKKQLQEHIKAVEARTSKLVRQAEGLDEAGRELFIHDFICSSVRYDKLKKPYSHEVIGPLTQGVGVCEGIAKTIKLLCNRMNIPCIVAFCEDNPAKGIKYRHAWNVVKIAGKYYHLDATFDSTLSREGVTRYDYFNLGDASFFRDHEPLVWKVPECTDNSANYYVRNKLSFTKTEDLRKRASQWAKKGREAVFHWRGGYLTREKLHEICLILQEEAEKTDKTAEISLNWPQAVIHVRFVSGEIRASVTLEDANEGEIEDTADERQKTE